MDENLAIRVEGVGSVTSFKYSLVCRLVPERGPGSSSQTVNDAKLSKTRRNIR